MIEIPAETYINIGGTNRKIGATGVYVRNGGVWNPVNFTYVNIGGGWQTAYIRDVSGPAAPTNVRATWEGNALRITWTNPADSDYAYMAVNVEPGSDPFIFGSPVPAPGNSVLWTTHILNNLVYTVQLIPVDSNGNVGTPVVVTSMGWTGVARGKTPSPYVIWPVDSGTWYLEGGAWRPPADIANHVQQGGFTGGQFCGMYFYGNQFFDFLRGTTISAASASFFRINSGGTPFPVSPTIWGSTQVSPAGSPMGSLYKGIITGPGLSLLGSPFPGIYNLGWPLPSTLFENMQSTAPTGFRFNAMGFYANDLVLRPDLGGGDVTASYMQLFSAYELPFNIKSGAIAIDHSG